MTPRRKKEAKQVIKSKAKNNPKNRSEQPKSTEGPRMMTVEELDAELDLTL